MKVTESVSNDSDLVVNVRIRGIDREAWREIVATSKLNRMSVAQLIELLWTTRPKILVSSQINLPDTAEQLTELQAVQRIARTCSSPLEFTSR